MSLNNAQLDQLDRELDENQRELIVLPLEGPITRIPPFTTLPPSTQAPQVCTREYPGLLDGAWGRTQAAYNRTIHEYVNWKWGVPGALATYDIYNLSNFYRDTNGIKMRVRVSTHNGVPYLILTGSPGLRNKLKGTRYGLRNAQLIEMGIGKYGVRGTSIAGFKVSCYVAVGIEALEWIFDDEAVMSDLFGGIGVELIKAGIASAVAYVGAAITAGLATYAAAPIIIGAFIVLAVAVGLNTLDNHYKIKKSVKLGLRQALDNAREFHEGLTSERPFNPKWNPRRKLGN